MHTSTFRLIFVACSEKTKVCQKLIDQNPVVFFLVGKEFKYHFLQSKFLFYYWWITYIKNYIIAVNIVANYSVCFRQCWVTFCWNIVRTTKSVIIKITFIDYSKSNFIRNHSMWPKEFKHCWNISVEFEKWITNLTKNRDNNNKQRSFVWSLQKFHVRIILFSYRNSFNVELEIFRVFIMVQKCNSQLWDVMPCINK